MFFRNKDGSRKWNEERPDCSGKHGGSAVLCFFYVRIHLHDRMREAGADYLCGELYPDKEQVNLLKVWVGPNYIAAFDRRETGYQEYEESGKVHTLEVIGPTDYGNAAASMHDVMSATLMKYGEGEVDGIWVAYDAYA